MISSSPLVGHGQPAAYFTFASLTELGVPHATTTRHCPGITSFAEPILPEAPKPPFRSEASEVLGATGLEMGRVSYARQVHGADAARVPAGGGFAGLVDILVTAERGVPLAIFTADCLAIVLCDPAAGALGVAHVGWRGTVKGATQRAVRAIGEVGGQAARCAPRSRRRSARAATRVDEPVTAEFARAFGDRWRAWVTPSRAGAGDARSLVSERGAPGRGGGPAGVDRESAAVHRVPSRASVLVSAGAIAGRLVTLAALP